MLFNMNPLQERQLVLSEALNSKLDVILKSQKTLEQQNEELRKENQGLREAMIRRDEETEQSSTRRRSKRCNVTVPSVLRVSS